MMPASRRTGSLEIRLERLTGEDAAGCVPRYRRIAADVTASTQFRRAFRRVRALADEHRLLALALLKRRGELCACEIQAATGLTHATVSHHMSILAAAGFVSGRRAGKWMYYRLAGPSEVGIP